MKALIKLAIAVLLANALWHAAAAYISFYRFRDSVDELASHAAGRSDVQLKEKVMELAATYEEPVDPDALEIRHENDHLYIDTEYIKPVALFPGYEYQWPFTLNVDGFVIIPKRLNDLANPK
jgi:hypothetical protein